MNRAKIGAHETIWPARLVPLIEAKRKAAGVVDKDLIRLRDLSRLLDGPAFDEMLSSMAQLAAQTVGAQQCSILLANGEEGGNVTMSVCASYGTLAPEAFKEFVARHQGISGEVAATGEAMLIEDIHQSRFAAFARRPAGASGSLISAPMLIGGGVIGVINLSDPWPDQPFNAASLKLVEVLAALTVKSVQLGQVQSVLKSRFARIALANEASTTVGKNIDAILQNPDQVAKILAKSFYKEMAKAGFGTKQIISAASEIINQLSSNIQRHNKRIVQKSSQSED